MNNSVKNTLLDHLNSIQKPWKFLAPMVGNSELAYRILSRRHGADVCYTEMVNCKSFNNNKCNPINNQWYNTNKEDRPLVIQICGDDPETMLKTCLAVQDHCDAIDINFGCPQEIAKKGHYGSFLQDEWDLIYDIVSTCSRNINIPLFCKIRIFQSVEKTVEYAKIFERAGASLLAVHGRTREQKGENTGFASWDHIRAIKKALNIPVIANGNMIYHEDIRRCYEYTGCDGVMLAEPHLFNPGIFESKELTSFEIFEEFLEIAQSTVFEGGPFKSHCFKIFQGIFKKKPEMRTVLDKCKKIEDYFCFYEEIKQFKEEGRIEGEDLKMKPYIRAMTE